MDLASRFFAFSTILHLAIVTFERYVMIIHPMQYRKIISKQTTVASMILIWIFALSLSFIELFWISLDSTQTRETRATYGRYLQLLLFRIPRGASCYPLCNRLRLHFPCPPITTKENSSTALSYYREACEAKTRATASDDHFWLNDSCLYLRLDFILSMWNFFMTRMLRSKLYPDC